MKIMVCLLLGAVLATAPIQAQHEHHQAPPDTTATSASGMEMGMHDMNMPDMSSFTLPGLPMQRDGSGTSWLPNATPMHAIHRSQGAWNLMFHGAAFLRYTAQDAFDSGTRSDQALDAPNWLMGMASRAVGRHGQLGLRAMLSLDPLTEGGGGYPLLFQTGETFEGEPLIDRQHPHDLFGELAVTYGQTLGKQTGIFLYAGLPGEPALGPVAFMHRPSAQHNPDAPLGHHWQDATHITFGTATLGLRFGPVMAEGSVFTGREPNEARYDFDKPRFDSYSARLSANPTEQIALQVSRGFLKSPESLEPDTDVWRTTASAIYHTALSNGYWTNTLLWGMNEAAGEEDGHGGHSGTQHSLLAESDVTHGRQAFYGRAEWVQKPAEELGLAREETFNVGALTLGTARDLFTAGSFYLSLGAQGSVYRVPDDLQSIYGNNPVSLEVYLRLSPRLLSNHARHSMQR